MASKEGENIGVSILYLNPEFLQCTLEKTLVTKVHPESSCKKISRRICAPSNCVMKKAEKVRTEMGEEK